jgi:Zn-dependent peptidase ImmA (M78 family)
LRKVDVAKAIGLTPTAITQYEQGRTRPSGPVVAALALHLGFPRTFFDRGRPLATVTDNQAHFRRLRSTSKLDRERLLARLSLIAEVIAEVEHHVSLPTVAIPDIPGAGEDDGVVPEHAAAEVRRRWGLGSGPIQHVVRLIEGKGVIVIRHDVDTTDVDAFSAVIAGRPVAVLASDKDDAARSRMDAAHELGHLIMHHDVEPGRQSVEREAWRFAAAFLMPADAMRAELPRYMDWDAYIALKLRWRVSLAALLYRARTLGIISPDAHQRAHARMSARGWREHEPGDIGPAEQPTVLHKALTLMESRRGVSTRDVAARLHLSQSDFDSLLADIASDEDRSPNLKVM